MPIPSRRLGELTISQQYSAATRYLELPAQEFIYMPGVSSMALLSAAVLALLIANSSWGDYYFRLWEARLSFDIGIVHLQKSLHHWINDGLMSIFFFLVGMEIKHEIMHGQLSSVRKAALPIFGALGGMIVPALIYAGLNRGTLGAHGWGIPMATDIAFAAGVMALVPGLSQQIKVFLLALAIVDDIGAIIVIAVFYSESISLIHLAGAFALLFCIWLVRRANVTYSFPYVLLGIAVWLLVLRSGVHATIAGVVLAFFVSSTSAFSPEKAEEQVTAIVRDFRAALHEGDRARAEANLGALETVAINSEAPIERIMRELHPWVAFVVLPLFAFANSGVVISTDSLRAAWSNPVLWGVVAGLILGKPVGIVLFSWVAAKLNLAELPPGAGLAQLIGTGMVAGIGFTVSIFIADLAFNDAQLVSAAKIGILLSSLLAGVLGFVFLILARRPKSA